MSLILSLFLSLAAAHACGALSKRLGHPPLAGHLFAGVVIGPAVLSWVEPDASLRSLSDLAVLMVVLNAGLEMRLQHIAGELRGWGLAVLLIGFLPPAAAGAAIAAAFSLTPTATAVVALCLAVTALPVALQILSAMDLLDTAVARVALAGALLADILVFAVLGVLIDVSTGDAASSTASSIAAVAGKLFALGAAAAIAHALCRRLAQRRADRPAARNGVLQVELAYVLLFVLALAAVSELAGFHYAIGAFLAALMITPEVIGQRAFERAERTCDALVASLFGPLFLVFQGLQFDMQSLSQPTFTATLVAAAVLAKLASGYVVGRLKRMSPADAWGVGVVMNARGVMELIAASIAFRAGLIDSETFSALAVVGALTTVLTPLMLKHWRMRTLGEAAAPSR